MSRVWIYDAVSQGAGDPMFCKGIQVERAMAMMADVQTKLDQVAHGIQVAATANLAAVRADPGYTGSFESDVLPVESGDIDRFVVLSDERGQLAAWMIEVGSDVPPMVKWDKKSRRTQAGKHVLSHAALAAVLTGGGL